MLECVMLCYSVLWYATVCLKCVIVYNCGIAGASMNWLFVRERSGFYLSRNRRTSSKRYLRPWQRTLTDTLIVSSM